MQFAHKIKLRDTLDEKLHDYINHQHDKPKTGYELFTVKPYIGH